MKKNTWFAIVIVGLVLTGYFVPGKPGGVLIGIAVTLSLLVTLGKVAANSAAKELEKKISARNGIK